MIIIKTEAEIAKIHEGGKILSDILKKICLAAKPGMTTADLEKLACELIKRAGGRPSFKGYCPVPQGRPYPTALCISINHQVVHAPALPAREIFNGDLVSIDIGMEYPAQNGYFTDMAVSFGVGKISPRTKKLMDVTKKSLELAIKKVRPGATIYDIGRTVEDYVVSHGFSVVRDLVGHGVGKAVHEEPQIPNFPMEANKKILLKPGMVIAIEPMVNMGRHEVVTGPDGMSIDSADESLSAHFEHTVAVTKTGHLVLTTLHTHDVWSIPGRLADLGVSTNTIAEHMVGALHQKLVPHPTLGRALKAEILTITPALQNAIGQGVWGNALKKHGETLI